MPSEALEVLIAAPSGVSVFAPTAQTIVVNDNPVPGAAAEPAFFEISGGGALQKVGSNYVLNLGDVVEGQSASVRLGVSNNATAPADSLAGTIAGSGAGGFSVTGDGALPTALQPGQSYQGLHVQVGTAALGAQSETITLSPLDQNETGYSGSLAPVTIKIEDDVLAPAATAIDPAAPQPATIDLGTVRVGPAPSGDPNASLAIENAAAAGAANLDAWVAGFSSGLTASGSITGLAPGQTSANIAVGLDTSVGGAKSGVVQIASQSDAGGGQTASLPDETVSVSGTVYKEAAISVAPVNAVVHVGDPTEQSLLVVNTDAANGYSEGAVVTETGVTGAGLTAVSGTTGAILAGQSSDALEVQLASTAAAGRYSGQVLLDLKTEGGSVVDSQGQTSSDGFGETDLGATLDNVTIDVYNHASAAFEKTSGAGTLTQSATNANAYTLDLGAFAQNSGSVASGFGVVNTAPVSSFSDWLSGVFSISGNASGAFAQASFAEFNDLLAGQADASPEVVLSTAQAGHFAETITLTPTGSDSSGWSEGLTPETLTIEGDVLPVTITPQAKTVDLGDGDGSVSETLDIVDNELSGDPITARIVGFTGAVTLASDASVALPPGGEDNSTLAESFSTTTSGVQTGTVSVALSQDGASLGTVSVPVTLTVDNPAVAEIQKVGGVGTLTQTGDNAYTLDLGATTQGSAGLLADLDVLNAAAVPSDALNGSFTGPTGDPEYANGGFGTFSGYTAGYASGQDAVELTTYKVGTFTETFTLHPTETLSDGTTTALPDQTVTVTGTVLPKVYVAPTKLTALAWGDVHLTTFDGLMYNFQAAGEFTLAKSTVAGDDFKSRSGSNRGRRAPRSASRRRLRSDWARIGDLRPRPHRQHGVGRRPSLDAQHEQPDDHVRRRRLDHRAVEQRVSGQLGDRRVARRHRPGLLFQRQRRPRRVRRTGLRPGSARRGRRPGERLPARQRRGDPAADRDHRNLRRIRERVARRRPVERRRLAVRLSNRRRHRGLHRRELPGRLQHARQRPGQRSGRGPAARRPGGSPTRACSRRPSSTSSSPAIRTRSPSPRTPRSRA